MTQRGISNIIFLAVAQKLIDVIRFKQLMTIKYLEDKFYKSKNDITVKLMERRREDVRDQMKELSNSKPPLLMNQEETIEEEARQRRAAEREVNNQTGSSLGFIFYALWRG